MTKWQIIYTDEAEKDLGFFVEKHPKIWKEL